MSRERLQRGGIARLLLYRRDTGESLDLPAQILPGDRGGSRIEHSPDRAVTAAGTERTIGEAYRMQVQLIDGSDMERVRTWERDRAQVEAIVLGWDEGMHRVWHEPVTPLLTRTDGAHGEFGGDVMSMATSVFDALVTTSDNLLDLDPWRDLDGDGQADHWSIAGNPQSVDFIGTGEAGSQIVTAHRSGAAIWRDYILPAPGARLYLRTDLHGGHDEMDNLLVDPESDQRVTLVVEALTASQMAIPPPGPGEISLGYAPLARETVDVIFPGHAGVWITLPPRTYAVRLAVEVVGDSEIPLGPVAIYRPTLTTRQAYVVGRIQGGFFLTASDTNTVTLLPVGEAWIEETELDVTFLGNIYTVGYAELGPPNLLAMLSEYGHDGNSLKLQVI